MKAVWLVLGILLLTVGSSFWLYFTTESIYREIQKSLTIMEKEIEEGNWQRAQEESDRLKEIWARADSFWTPVMDHRELNHLDESITRLIRLLQLRQKEEVLLEIHTAQRLTLRLKNKEIPGLRNVF